MVLIDEGTLQGRCWWGGDDCQNSIAATSMFLSIWAAVKGWSPKTESAASPLFKNVDKREGAHSMRANAICVALLVKVAAGCAVTPV